MDNLTLAQKLLGKEKTTENTSEAVNPSSASIVYMIAVTASSNGEVVLKDEIEESYDWDDEAIEIDDDGDFEEYEPEEDSAVDDTVVDMTDGDGVDIEGTDAESVSFSVGDYHEAAMAAYEEQEVVEDELPDENAEIADEIDDGDAETIPDVGTDDADDLADETAEVDDLTDEEYTLQDDNSDDESDDPIEGAEISDGYTIAECIGSIKEGDRVAVMIQDGKPIVIGVVGSGDELFALMQHASEEASEASEVAETAKEQAGIAESTAETAKEQAENAIKKAGQAEEKANSASESATAASKGIENITKDLNTVKTDASQTLAQAIEANTEKKVEKMTASFATKTDLKEQKIDLESEIERSAGKIKSTLSAEYARKTDLTEAKVEMQSAIEQTSEKITFSVSEMTDAFANTQNEEIKAQIAQAKAKLETAKNELASAKTTLNEAVAKKDLAIENAAKAQNELSDAQATFAQAQKELADAESYYDKLVEIGASTEEIEQARADIQAAEDAVTSAQTAVAEAQSKATQAETAVTSATNAVNTAQSNVNTAQVNVDLAENGLHEKNMTAIEQTAESITLKVTKNEMNEAIDDIAVGGRNLIQNSTNMIFNDYYFYEAGESNPVSAAWDDGDVTVYGATATHDGDGNTTLTYSGGNVDAGDTVEMETLTVNGTTFEVVDKRARNDIDGLSEEIADLTEEIAFLKAVTGDVDVVGTFDENNVVTLNTNLEDGTYEFKFFNRDEFVEVVTLVVGAGDPEEPDTPDIPNPPDTTLTWDLGTKIDSSTGVETTGNTTYSASNYIEIVDGYTYTVYKNMAKWDSVKVVYYDENQSFISCSSSIISETQETASAVIPIIDGAKYFRIRLYHTVSNFDDSDWSLTAEVSA